MNSIYALSFNKGSGTTELVAIATPQLFSGEQGFLIEFRDGQSPRHLPVFIEDSNSLLESAMNTVANRIDGVSFIEGRMIDFNPQPQSRMKI